MDDSSRSAGSQWIAISIVSHGHGPLIMDALQSLADALAAQSTVNLRVFLTLNLPEPELAQSVQRCTWPFELALIHNEKPLGFGANHNQAFSRVQACGGSQWFIVMNPDIFWPVQAGHFWEKLVLATWPADVGLVCPIQTDTLGGRQDFARELLVPWGMAWRFIRRMLRLPPSGVAASVEAADWVNGACMVWRSDVYASIRGFDEQYFMYCEDTDICLRMQLAGWRMAGADMAVVHDARRHTGRSLRHLRWHVRSILRVWCSPVFWRFVFFKRRKS